MPDTDLIQEVRALLEKIKPAIKELGDLVERAEREEKQAALDNEFRQFTEGLDHPVQILRPLRFKKPGQ